MIFPSNHPNSQGHFAEALERDNLGNVSICGNLNRGEE
jgi:hypothetical protein